MRIAMLTSEFLPFHGGIGSYARELALAATTAGHEVTVLAPDYGQDCSTIDAGFPFAVHRYSSDAPTMRTLPARIKATRNLLKENDFDVVHAIDWPFFIPLRLSRGRLGGARALMTVHGTEILYMQAPKRRILLDVIGFWKTGWSSWIANSRYTAELLLRSFPKVPSDKVKAIPLGLADDWKAGRTERSAARAALSVPDDRFIMISLGRVVPRKGHGVVAEALGKLAPTLARQVEWWIIGPLLDANHAAFVRQMTEGQLAQTKFLGSLPGEEVKLRLSAADLFCLPGYQAEDGSVEGFGLVFLEASAYGVPSIASKSGGIPEAVEDGVTGILVPERDSDALALAIEQMVTDPKLRTTMAEAAKAKADAAGWDKVMNETYRLDQPA